MDSSSPPSVPANQRPVMNLSRSLDRMGGDRSILHDLATFFLEDSQQLLATLDSAVTAQDSKQAARSAHSLSGLSANFTADSCVALGKGIEELCLKGDFTAVRSLMADFQKEIARLVEAIRLEILADESPVKS